MANRSLITRQSSRAAIRELQRRLALAGFNPGRIDGILGKRTRAAVIAFQKANDLKVDGIVGPRTLEKLNSGVAEGPSRLPRPRPELQAVRPAGPLGGFPATQRAVTGIGSDVVAAPPTVPAPFMANMVRPAPAPVPPQVLRSAIPRARGEPVGVPPRMSNMDVAREIRGQRARMSPPSVAVGDPQDLRRQIAEMKAAEFSRLTKQMAEQPERAETIMAQIEALDGRPRPNIPSAARPSPPPGAFPAAPPEMTLAEFNRLQAEQSGVNLNNRIPEMTLAEFNRAQAEQQGVNLNQPLSRPPTGPAALPVAATGNITPSPDSPLSSNADIYGALRSIYPPEVNRPSLEEAIQGVKNWLGPPTAEAERERNRGLALGAFRSPGQLPSREVMGREGFTAGTYDPPSAPLSTRVEPRSPMWRRALEYSGELLTGGSRQPYSFTSAPGARLRGVDPRLLESMDNAASRYIAANPGYRVEVTPRGGMRDQKPGGTTNHPKGRALDVQIYDNTRSTSYPNGKPLPNLRSAKSFRDYEQLMQAARQYQLANYPELTDTTRFGGYFRQGVPYDQMHIDITSGNTALGNWRGGLNRQGLSGLPGAVSVGMGENANRANANFSPWGNTLGRRELFRQNDIAREQQVQNARMGRLPPTSASSDPRTAIAGRTQLPIDPRISISPGSLPARPMSNNDIAEFGLKQQLGGRGDIGRRVWRGAPSISDIARGAIPIDPRVAMVPGRLPATPQQTVARYDPLSSVRASTPPPVPFGPGRETFALPGQIAGGPLTMPGFRAPVPGIPNSAAAMFPSQAAPTIRRAPTVMPAPVQPSVAAAPRPHAPQAPAPVVAAPPVVAPPNVAMPPAPPLSATPGAALWGALEGGARRVGRAMIDPAIRTWLSSGPPDLARIAGMQGPSAFWRQMDRIPGGPTDVARASFVAARMFGRDQPRNERGQFVSGGSRSGNYGGSTYGGYQGSGGSRYQGPGSGGYTNRSGGA